ncbi:MAG: hypothetical protein QOH93_203 [Chloroflexia bacterium]|jgi:hypothetical protein|nr:hypothetical protein [Chloroflexia bacterium]
MSKVYVEVEGMIDAPAQEVYDIISDYEHGHPHILPKEHFSDLVVEEGGKGAGTIIRFRNKAGGVERSYRMRISEPEPGHVLVEKDTNGTDLATTFTVTSVDGSKSGVRISTEWTASDGVQGLVERLFAPRMLRPVYKKELRQLAEYARGGRAPVTA